MPDTGADRREDGELGALVSGRGYGSWLPEPPTVDRPDDSLQATRRENAMGLIKNILARKPATISPTIPRLEPDAGSLRADPLDLDRIPGTEDGNAAKGPRPVPTATTPRHPRTAKRSRADGTPSRTTERSQPVGGLAGSNSGVGASPSLSASAMRLQEHFRRMEAIQAREQFSDTIEEWRGMLGLVERLETIETAKAPRDTVLISSCAATMAWIADHLVELTLRHIQVRAATGDDSAVMAQIAQVAALREQARQSYLRALHHNPALSTGPHHTLAILIGNLAKN